MVKILNKKRKENLEIPINEGSKRKFLLMKEDYITLRFSLTEPEYFNLGDYVEIPDDPTGRFELCDLCRPTYNQSTGGYDYELRMDAYYWKWKNKKFFYTPKDSVREASWSLTATLPVHMEVFCRNLAAHGYAYNDVAFDIPQELKDVNATVGSAAKLIAYDNVNLLDALTLIAETWDCEWWITNNFIHFGRCEYGTPVDFELGGNVNKMDRSDSQALYATRIYAFGSDRNLPSTYRKDLIFDVKTINGRDLSDTSRILKTSYFRESDLIKAPDHAISVYMTQSHTETYSSSVAILAKSSSTSVDAGSYMLSFTKLNRSIRLDCASGSVLKPVFYVDYFVEVGYTKSNGTKETIRITSQQQYIYSYAADISIPIADKEITLSENVTDFYVLISYTPVFSSNGSVIISNKAIGTPSLIKPNENDSAKVNITTVSGLNKGNTFSCILNPDHTEMGHNTIRLPEGASLNTGDRYTIDNIIKSRVPDHYFSKVDGEERAIEGIVNKRLMLPKDTPYIDAYENMKPEEIIEGVVVFDDIYPRRTGTISSVDDTEKGYYEDSEGNKTDKTYPIYKIKDATLTNFKESYKLDKLIVSFQTGIVAGMDFEVELISSDESGTVFKILRNSDYGRELPDEKLYPKPTNTYVLQGYDVEFVSDTMIPEAEQELKKRAKEESDKLKIDPSTYNCEMSSVYAFGVNPISGEADSAYAKRFDVGDRINLINKTYFENGRQSRVIGYEYPLDIPYDHPVYIVGETAAYSRIGEIESKIESLTYKGQTFVGGGNGSGSSVYLIGTHDSTNSTNRNAFSALRTIQEIVDRSLSKQTPDASNEIITFLKGLVSRGTIQADGGLIVRSSSSEGLSLAVIEEENNPVGLASSLLEVATPTAGGATTLGALDNVAQSADDVSGTNDILCRKPGVDQWDVNPLVWMEGFKCVRTLAERDVIPVDKLSVPSLCFVYEQDFFYLWDGESWKDKEMGGGPVEGVQRNVRIVNNLDSKNLAASKGDPCPLNFTFVSQERYSSKDPYENTGERGLLELSVKNTVNAEYVVVKQMYIPSGVPVQVDVAEFLTSGANNVMLKVTGEATGVTTPAFVYTVQLTSLSISANNFKWWTAYSGDILLPLNIGGNVSKTLYVTVAGKEYLESYQIPLGTGIYVETAYNCLIPHTGKTGVFNLSAYVTNADGSIRTKTVSFHVICVLQGATDKLVAINNLLPKATNWSENTLFDYAMYDGDNIYTSARFLITKEGELVFSSAEDAIAVSTCYSFSLPLEVDTLDNSEFSIVASVLDNDTLLTDAISIPVNNSLGYSAVAGATLYLNPKTRSNRQDNRQQLINETDGSPISALWTGVNWGNDCWQSDTNGSKVLRLLAGSAIEIDHSPFCNECARSGKTLELDYLVSNVTDFTRPVLTISSPVGESFIGLNIYPDDIIMYSQSLKNEDVQSLHTFEEKRTRLTLTILPDAYGNAGFNLCILYINGIKNREFTYENNDYFAHEGKIRIGSDYADVDIYGIREYNSALTSQAVLANHVNWLSTTDEKAKFKADNDILDTNGSEIDYDNTKDQYNVMVFDNTIPSMADQSTRVGNLEVQFYDHPEWNVTLSNVTAKGQGTSSMKYWIWNTRYQLDKNLTVITHADGTTSKKVWQMVPGIPAGQKFTAKKNFASSMQSHKIGAVNSYTDLYRQVGLANEAMQTEQHANARVSVYELPFFCFEKSLNDEGNYVYTFKGLYTFGPDKGDKYCFGHDTDLFPGLIAIEGSDNSPLLTLFRVPWNVSSGRVVYNEDEEAWQYNGANSFDFGAGQTANISKWIPTYNHVYACSPRLLPFDGTSDELNANLSVYRTQPFEFWIAKAEDSERFNVYYYESSAGRFIPSDTGEGTINLASQLADNGYGLSSSDLAGKTNEELNTLFIRARIAKFRKEAPHYWDVDDCLFFMNNVEFNAGTDERAKNTYPYSFGTETSKWRWRVDDADTRFDTTNRGLPDKGYDVETHDVDRNGASVWNGETNNFFNLMELAFPEEKATSMRRMMAAMQTLGGLKSGNDLEKIYAFYQKYYFDQAQEYFPANSYNADAKYCYENGKLAYMAGLYSNDTDPITQSLGDHYLAEQRWITKRIIYMMGKYSFGLFSAGGTDTITVRAAGNTIQYELTPAMDMYPAIANGTSIIRGARTKSGQVCRMEIELSGSGDQQNAIQGASYLQDIGDWHDKNVTGSMVIQGRMLREIRLGSKTEPITISISSLTVSNCVSLQKLLLSNISTLSGTLVLSACSHLKEVSADGTSLVQIKLPVGGGLEKVEYSGYNQYITLSNYPLMRNEGVGIGLCKPIITDFFVVDCPLMQPMKLLVEVMNAQADQGMDHALKRIRSVGFNETYDTSDMLEKLTALADGSYKGLSSEGLAGEDVYPVLDGTLNVRANAYEDSIESLRNTFKKLTLNITGEYYLRFKDAYLGKYFIDKYGDGIGTTKSVLGKIPNFSGSLFAGNTDITSFDEFQYFTGATALVDSVFRNCSNLSSIIFPETIETIGNWALQNCKIRKVKIPRSVITIRNAAFEGNSELSEVVLEDGLQTLGGAVFNGCRGLSEIDLPDTITAIGDTMFSQCTSLERCHYPENSSINVIDKNSFDGCIALKTIPLTKYITTIGVNAFRNCKSLSGHLDLNNITNLSDGSFYGCTGIESVNIEKLNKINFESFKNCSSLKNVELSSNLNYIGGSAFYNCVGLENLDLSEINGIIIQDRAFFGTLGLKSVKLPPNSTLYYAIFNSSGLEELTIPGGTVLNSSSTFYDCKSLKWVVIEDGVTKVVGSMFSACIALEKVTLPSSIVEIEGAPFHGCHALVSIVCNAVVPPTLVNNLGYIIGNYKIYVPDASLNAYKASLGWSQYANRIYPLSEIK